VSTVRVGSLDIAYHDLGAGEPVLLINGTGESGETWLPLVEPLAARRRLIAIDQRDTGASTYVTEPYRPADLAADALGVLDGLGIEAADVVGFSLGGAVAMEMALAAPARVRSLGLLSTWARSDAWFVAQMRSWQAIRLAHPDDDAAFLRALDAWLFSPVTFEQRDRYDAIYRMWDAETYSQRADGWWRQCEADIAHDVADRLSGVRAPALVLVGEDDICTPARYSDELVRLLPSARRVTVPEAGHCALFERPDEVRAAIVALLEEA